MSRAPSGGEVAPSDSREFGRAYIEVVARSALFDGLWRVGDGAATPWLQVFTTDFMARAKQAGYWSEVSGRYRRAGLKLAEL